MSRRPAPTSPDGRPDLSGLWRVDPGGYALNLVSDLKPSEIQPWAEELYKKRSEEFGKDFPGCRCMPDIGPFATFGMFKLDPNPTWQGYAIHTTFAASGAPVIFHVDAKGIATDFVVHTVEGDQRYVRIKLSASWILHLK